ncbi:hypothetical protein HPB52_023514 [Rhipicephalus sanguineus]|uniref:Uncharacterized protein n=1 Tax=Rhipicephalus sanguineus TaxID=34632 RepID=A0A9D4TC44_RHISA|nr:hypothetical protein HPB52_023514 [Rhipicephalus sanguineus]
MTSAVREVRRSRQDYLAGRLARRYDPGHVATLPLPEWNVQPPLDDWSRRADAGFLNLPLPRRSRRADVGLPRRTTGAQGHNSLPPEPACHRLQFVYGGAEPPEFDAATLRFLTVTAGDGAAITSSLPLKGADGASTTAQKTIPMT